MIPKHFLHNILMLYIQSLFTASSIGVKLNPVLYQNVEKLPVHNVGSCSQNVFCCASCYVLNHLLKLQQKGLIENQWELN